MSELDDAYGRVEALTIHSITGHEWDCTACHYHYLWGNTADGKCPTCGRTVDESNVQEECDDDGTPCDHGALLDRDAVLQALSAAAES